MPIPDSAKQTQRDRLGRPNAGWRLRLYTIVFESDTRAGRLFDLTLIGLILASVGIVMVDSVESIHTRWGEFFTVIEWFFTAIFSVEYVLRLVCVQRPRAYATSFLGVVDLLSVAPTYLALFFPGLQALIDVRVLRMLRIFRILKLGA